MISPTDYRADRITVDGIETVHLIDPAREITVRIAPSFGNNAYQITVKGKQVLWFPPGSQAEWRNNPSQVGNPFLAPWANRIDGHAYWVNGKKYHLNPELGNYRKDANQNPLHGVLVYAPWQVTRMMANEQGAELTSRLEFWRNPQWMTQFPFAHNLEMTHRLRDGVLEVDTALENVSNEPMPVSIGFHTYYQVNDAPRDEWTVRIPARRRARLSDKLLPTGEFLEFPSAQPHRLASAAFDDVFDDMERDSAGRAEFTLTGKTETVRVFFGPKFKVGVVFAPPGRPFVCFEPMTGLTDAFNLAHRGVYTDLQSVAPGQIWRESFWIEPSGY